MRKKQIKLVKLSEIRPGEYFRVMNAPEQCLCVSTPTRCDGDRRSYVILGDDEIPAFGDLFAMDEQGRWTWEVYRTDRHGNAIEFAPQPWQFCDLHEGDCFTVARDPDAYYCVVSEATGDWARVVLATGAVQTPSTSTMMVGRYELVQPITVSLTITPKESV